MAGKLNAMAGQLRASAYARHAAALLIGVLVVWLGLSRVVYGINHAMFGYDPLQWIGSEAIVIFGSMLAGAALAKIGQLRYKAKKEVGRG